MNDSGTRFNWEALIGFVLSIVFLTGCGEDTSTRDYVARLGDQVLTRQDLDAALATLPALQDTLVAREQILEQWITNELLFREALNLGLRNEPEVQRLLSENERSVLISLLLSRLYEENDTSPDETELLSYYEQHKDQLELMEPYLRIRYVGCASPDTAAVVRDSLLAVNSSPNPDSMWAALVIRFSDDPEASSLLSSSFYPESRLLSFIPGLNTALQSLSPGQVLPPFELAGRFHVVQLVDRLPTGTIPELDLIAGEVRQRVVIENRKQLYARQVQRLRIEALAREELDVR